MPHTLIKMGETIELEDGSAWSVSIYDIPVALNWQINDSIAVTQNTRWFTEYPYRLVNRENGTTVETDLIKAGTMIFVDTEWQIESPDIQAGDNVTIGDNADSDPNWEYILILDKKFVRAKKL